MHKGAHIIQELDRLRGEAEVVYRTVVLPGWLGPKHGMPDTLYGYMMGVFARVDLMSAYWRGTFKDQSIRMVSFMTMYMQPDRIANSVAVQTWRHKLMHTAAPRELRDPHGGPPCRWLLHWGDDHLPRDHLFQFQAGNHNLNLSLFALIENTRSAASAYIGDLSASSQLSANYDTVDRELESYEFRPL
jgi:hypothetical protein